MARLRSPLPLVASAALVFVLGVVLATAQGQPQPAADARLGELTVLSREGRRPLVTASVNGQEMVSLADLSAMFSLGVREDTAAGGLIVTSGERSLVLSMTQGLASVGGRVVTLPAAPVKRGTTWFVPVDFIARALSLIHPTRLDLRRGSRLLVVGDLRVPRVIVRNEEAASGARVTVDVTPRVGYEVEQQGSRLLVRFEADALDPLLSASPVPDLLTSVQVVEPLTAVGLDLGPRFASYRTSEEAAAPARPLRITIDLVAQGATTVPGVTPGAMPTVEPPPVIFETPQARLRTIVLDPGHGGTEEGAKGPGGTLEKDVALAVARQLKATLEQRLGVRVLLTRDGDETVPLDERAAFANNNKADLFVSLHANASVRAAVSGAEVFYLSLDEYGPEGRRVAEAEGSAISTLGGGARDIDLILWDMAQMQHIDASAHLATLIERALRERVPMSPRAIQQAPFRVLVGANMPAVLVEMGFITNPDEEKLLGSHAHQQRLVQAIYASIVEFRAYLDRGGQASGADAPRSPVPQGAR